MVPRRDHLGNEVARILLVGRGRVLRLDDLAVLVVDEEIARLGIDARALEEVELTDGGALLDALGVTRRSRGGESAVLEEGRIAVKGGDLGLVVAQDNVGGVAPILAANDVGADLELPAAIGHRTDVLHHVGVGIGRLRNLHRV